MHAAFSIVVPIYDNKVWPRSMSDPPHYLLREAHAVSVRPAPVIRPVYVYTCISLCKHQCTPYVYIYICIIVTNTTIKRSIP